VSWSAAPPIDYGYASAITDVYRDSIEFSSIDSILEPLPRSGKSRGI
jgi:hypothetical protein